MSTPSGPTSDSTLQRLRQRCQRFSEASRKNRWVPIRPLRERHRGRLEQHLLGLAERDRYLRFGYPASDEQIQNFVAGLDFNRDAFYGIYDRQLSLIGTAHLALSAAGAPESAQAAAGSMAEFAVSVSPWARGHGYGSRLFNHAVMRARHRHIERLFIHALTENTAMLRIARRAGATVEHFGSESEAWLQLPASGMASRWGSRVSDQAAAMNYQFKLQRRILLRVVELIQDVRKRFADIRHIAAQ